MFGSLHAGRATLREAANNDSKRLVDREAGTVVTVLEVGKSHALVEINDQTGYLRNDCLGCSVLQREQVLRSMLVGGAKVNVRGGADKDSCRIAQWPAGTRVPSAVWTATGARSSTKACTAGSRRSMS